MGILIFDPSWRASFTPKDRRPIYEWAAEHVELFPPLTKTGLFDVSGSRQMIGPLEALQDDHVREVNIRAPVRSGKTLIGDLWLPWLIQNAPGPFRWVFQDDAAAKDQCELRTWPILAAIPEIAAMMPANRHKNRTQEIILPGMPIHVKGPALGLLQSRGWQYMVVDEPWQYKAGRIAEIKGRMGDFVKMGTDKSLWISQAGVEEDDWDEQLKRGIMHEWAVACLGCAKHFLPIWTGTRPDGSKWGMRWDTHKTEGGLWIIERALPTVRFECEHCGFIHIDSGRTKAEWNRTGLCQVEATEKPRARKSYHWTAIIDYPWTNLVDLYLQAINAYKNGTVHALISFFQKYMAENRSERTVLEGSESFSRTAYVVTSEWEFEDRRFMTVDRQDEDVYWVTARAWSRRKGGETRRLWWGRCFSPSDIEERREELKIRSNHVLIDSGYRPKGDNGVYAACVRYGWIAVKGDDEPFFWHPRRGGGRVRRSYAPLSWGDPESGGAGQGRGKQARLIRFSAPEMAERVKQLMRDEKWIEPKVETSSQREKELEIEYSEQMRAEYKKKLVNERTHKVEWIWVCPSGNNHAFDCAKEQVLAATLDDILPDPFQEDTKEETVAKAA